MTSNEGIALTMQDRHRSRGHAVTPYRIEQDRMTANYRIICGFYICDSNWPGDDSSIVQIFITLGTDAYGWNYGADMGDLYGDVSISSLPVCISMEQLVQTFGSSPSSKHPVIAATANGVAVYIPYALQHLSLTEWEIQSDTGTVSHSRLSRMRGQSFPDLASFSLQLDISYRRKVTRFISRIMLIRQVLVRYLPIRLCVSL